MYNNTIYFSIFSFINATGLGIFVGQKAAQFAIPHEQMFPGSRPTATLLSAFQVNRPRRQLGIWRDASRRLFYQSAVHHILLKVQILLFRYLVGRTAHGRDADDARKIVLVRQELDQEQLLLFGHLLVGFLLQQSNEECLDDAHRLRRTDALRSQILNADQLAHCLDDAVRLRDPVAFGHFVHEYFGVAVLREEIVVHRAVVAQIEMHQVVGGILFRHFNDLPRIIRGGMAHAANAILVARYNRADVVPFTAFRAHGGGDLAFDAPRLECGVILRSDWLQRANIPAGQFGARIAALKMIVDFESFPISQFVTHIEQFLAPANNRKMLLCVRHNNGSVGLAEQSTHRSNETDEVATTRTRHGHQRRAPLEHLRCYSVVVHSVQVAPAPFVPRQSPGLGSNSW